MSSDTAAYVDATSVLEHSRCTLAEYLNKRDTLSFLIELSAKHGIPTGVERIHRRVVLSDVDASSGQCLLSYPQTPGSDTGTMVHPEVAANIALLCPPRPTQSAAGLVYAVTSNLVTAVKIGRWSGAPGPLISRYGTYYGKDLEMATVRVEDCKAAEKTVHDAMVDHCISGELFDKCCWSDAIAAMEEKCGPVDHIAVAGTRPYNTSAESERRKIEILQLQLAIKHEERLIEEQKTAQLREQSKAALVGCKRSFDTS